LRVRLTRKLAESVDGIDLSSISEGDCMELRPSDARMLILEGWAELLDPAPVEIPVEAAPEPATEITPSRRETEIY
jgi:hypothetical protein